VSHFLLQRAGKHYDYSAPLVSLSIRRVTTVHTPNGDVTRTEAVRSVQAAPC
jgi:hypothetical protein